MANIAPGKIEQTEFEAVTCPACGLLCDDISIKALADGNLKVSQNACAKSIQFFERPIRLSEPKIAGKTVSPDAAIAKASELLARSAHPLIAGLGAEVQGMRAIMSLADHIGASLDHMNSTASLRNTLVIQNSGWQVCTLTEVRNRVDLLVIIGTDVVSLFPRFFERVVWNKESMFDQDTSSREIVYLGGSNINTAPGISPDGRKPTVLPCDQARLPEVVATLRALVAGKKLVAEEVAGIAVSDLAKLAERLHAAKYSVIAWAAAALDFPHAELTVQNIAETVVTLNKKTRSSGLPLAGNEADLTANQVSTWTSGYPVRNSFIHSYPEYSPYQFGTEQLLDNNEADVLVWISSLNPEKLPPTSKLPTIVIGHPDLQLTSEPDVFIPVGIPGIDQKGTMFRSDNVVSLPLSQLRNTALPSLQSVIAAIEASVRSAATNLKDN